MLVSRGPVVAHVAWSAPHGCALSVRTAPLLAVPVRYFDLGPAWPSPLGDVWSWLASVIEATDGWILVLLTVLVVLLGGLALVISPRLPGRKGRWLANIAVALPLIVLVPLGALIVYLLFFWHPHFHFVG